MKKTNLLKTILLVATTMAGSIIAWGQETKTYELVSSIDDITPGSKYLFVSDAYDGKNYAIGDKASNNRHAKIVVVNNNTITASIATSDSDTSNPYEITINGSQDAWEFFDEVNNTYLKPRTGTYTGLQGGNNVETTWTISIAPDNIVTIVANSSAFTNGILQFNYNGGNPLFSCFKDVKSASNYKQLFLYKEIACTDPELTFIETEKTKAIGDAPFTNAATSVSGGAIIYSSADTDVATVDANTGEVTIVGAGTTAIKASIAADGDYCGAETSYTLTVEPCIIAAPVALGANLVAHDGFTANWETVVGADEYELSVYTGETSIELDVNGDFENWTDGKPDSWIGEKNQIAAAGIAQYSTSVQSGNYALQLKRDLDNHQRFSSKAVSVTIGTYTISFWVRGHGDIRTGLYDGRNGSFGYSEYNDYINVNSTTWEEHTQTVEVTNETDAAEFIFSVKSTNADEDHIQIDNVRIAKNVTPSQIPNSPFTTTETSYPVTELDAETEYFYVVKAIVNGCGESDNSETITVTTSKVPSGNGLNNIEKLHLYVSDGQIHFEAVGGEPVEIFNVMGQKIISQTAASGKNSIVPNAKGVLIIKVGKEINKVIFRQ